MVGCLTSIRGQGQFSFSTGCFLVSVCYNSHGHAADEGIIANVAIVRGDDILPTTNHNQLPSMSIVAYVREGNGGGIVISRVLQSL